MPINFRFNDDPSSEKKILPKYDDPAAEEVCCSLFLLTFQSKKYCECLYSSKFFVQGLTLDERGRFSGEAEKRLEEVRILFSIYFL
jgi:U4/U6.U5 tri-snRNP-associated protein 1